MSQIQGQFASGSQAKRTSPMDVYTGLLLAAFVVLFAGVISIVMANGELAEGEQSTGGALEALPGFTVIQTKD